MFVIIWLLHYQIKTPAIFMSGGKTAKYLDRQNLWTYGTHVGHVHLDYITRTCAVLAHSSSFPWLRMWLHVRYIVNGVNKCHNISHSSHKSKPAVKRNIPTQQDNTLHRRGYKITFVYRLRSKVRQFIIISRECHVALWIWKGYN